MYKKYVLAQPFPKRLCFAVLFPIASPTKVRFGSTFSKKVVLCFAVLFQKVRLFFGSTFW